MDEVVSDMLTAADSTPYDKKARKPGSGRPPGAALRHTSLAWPVCRWLAFR